MLGNIIGVEENTVLLNLNVDLNKVPNYIDHDNISANSGGVFDFLNIEDVNIQNIDFVDNYASYQGGAINI